MATELSNYHIQHTIGEGGMSTVYQAVDQRNNSVVAIKELNRSFTGVEELTLRFQQEVQVLKSLDHPNIVGYRDYFEQGGSMYLVMELVEGKTLDEYISKVTGPVPEEKAKKYMRQILQTFSYAHRKGIIHRDIKPQNIVLTPQNSIKVLDFGIAKMRSETSLLKTTPGSVIGTNAYMSPEQVLGRDIDLRSDIYSLGVLFHEIITGKCPYDCLRLSEYEISRMILQEPLPRLKEIYEFASDHMQAVIDRATEKNREQRFQSCDEFLDVLDQDHQTSFPIEQRKTQNNTTMKKITIGRHAQCDVVVNDPDNKVSRVHAEISLQGSGYLFRDKSSNGSVVNNRKIKNEEVFVAPGTRILLAGTVALPWHEIYQRIPKSQKAEKIEDHTALHRQDQIPQSYQANRNWYFETWVNAAFRGRASRQEFWIFNLVNSLIILTLYFAEVSYNYTFVAAAIFTLALLWPTYAVCVRRLHDTGRSGWWVLFGLIPVIGAIVLLVFYCEDSRPGANQYGPNPKGITG